MTLYHIRVEEAHKITHFVQLSELSESELRMSIKDDHWYRGSNVKVLTVKVLEPSGLHTICEESLYPDH